MEKQMVAEGGQRPGQVGSRALARAPEAAYQYTRQANRTSF